VCVCVCLCTKYNSESKAGKRCRTDALRKVSRLQNENVQRDHQSFLAVFFISVYKNLLLLILPVILQPT